MSDPGDLAAFLDAAWQRLSRGVADRRTPARHPTLATVSPDGQPEARTVVLRRADRAAATLDIHTDIESAKISALRANPRAQLHVWEPRANLQIRAFVEVEILTGASVEEQWARVPPAARVSYGTRPVPGTPIPSVFCYEKPSDRERFAVLTCHLQALDLVDLDGQHRRARFTRSDAWAGTWLAP